jgi:hypothetical protein
MKRFIEKLDFFVVPSDIVLYACREGGITG